MTSKSRLDKPIASADSRTKSSDTKKTAPVHDTVGEITPVYDDVLYTFTIKPRASSNGNGNGNGKHAKKE
ncbi:MAG: hypothetical protein GC204_19350 [Chloroflexi bacterium]|nr:hypothetical protein [Chloroflexota bacterium]